MSIRIETRTDGCAYPIIVCEQCRQRIGQAVAGMAIWPQSYGGGCGYSRARYTHTSCCGEYERINQPPAGCRWAHDDLRTHLTLLCKNVQHEAEPPAKSSPEPSAGVPHQKAWKGLFLAAYSGNGSIVKAAKAVSISYSAIYKQRDRDPQFAAAMLRVANHIVRARDKSRPKLKVRCARARKGEHHFRAKPFALRSPRGKIHTGHNLCHFVRTHPELFTPKDVCWKRRADGMSERCAALAGLQLVVVGRHHSWKDWTLAN